MDTKPAVHFGTVAQGRQHFKELLDSAELGVPNVVRRDRLRAVVVDGERLRRTLMDARPAHAQAVAENDGWSIMLPGLPLAADGDSFDGAIADMVDAMRDYAIDWVDHLRFAVNHRDNWQLVQLTDLSTDEQLAEWLTA
ncbi:prevent-host-death protein [Corynebacterium sp. AOP40-9SA-29]|uniref:prevent-host-death protein n=1 Tax=Corynebacterium sp. AOP40-9SA-29 TaxID=3457677 RepID=UPI004033585B